MLDTEILQGFATIVVLGVGAQWVGRRFGIPSILLLLPAGLVAGDVLEVVDPEELFGPGFFPGVSLLVGLLLFQASLRLRLTELPREARRPVSLLVTIGASLTFFGASAAVLVIFSVPASVSFLIGAVLIVSGPTVVGPLVQEIRPTEPTGSILNWEGVVLDPIGATVGIVVLNLIIATDRGGVHPVLQLMSRFGVGVGIGLGAAVLLVLVISRFLVTDQLEPAVAVLFAVAAFVLAEMAFSEAGLFATTAFGLAVANQTLVPTTTISGVGETLEVFIIGSLFVTLGALVELDALVDVLWRTSLLTAVLIVLVRPIATAVSLHRSKVTTRERAMIALVDPRGIVAAATAAQFSVTLSARTIDSDEMLPIVFGVILGTGIVYGLSAPFTARWLGVRKPDPLGVGLIGNWPWLRDFERALVDAGASVVRLPLTPAIDITSDDGLPAISTMAGQARMRDAVSSGEIAKVLVASTSGPGVELLSAWLIERLGRRHVVFLTPDSDELLEAIVPAQVLGTQPFAKGMTQGDMNERVAAGAKIEIVDDSTGPHLPLATVDHDGAVNLAPRGRAIRPGVAVVALVDGHGVA